ncbi:O-antigen ligase family protein [Pseudoflavonifractor sp.]|jgi:O-antigen ligase|uniref:O-antigen ligase family protein n=1 Tax=Pseudoflavonifractor sp. TaxID=1980281 RepID=UPI003D8D5567
MAGGHNGKKAARTCRAPGPRTNTPLFFLLAALLLLFGGYYDAMVFAAAALLAVLLAFSIHRAGALTLPRGPIPWLLAGLFLCSLVTLPAAISPGMALTGALRWLAALLFYLYAATYTQEERALILDSTAMLGAVMAAVSVFLFAATRFTGGTDANGRIDGFFQYANTYALFLLACLVLLLLKSRRPMDWPAMAALLLCIFLTGSRGVFLLLLAAGLFLAIRALVVKRQIRPVLLGVGALAVLGVLAVVFSGGLVLRRLAAITLDSSSLNGRLLYYLDGLRILSAHPLGIGRGGYLYLQPLVQTGPYILKSIHNEYLQAALDGGVLSGVLMAALVCAVVFRRGAPLRERLTAALLGLHAFIDFDFQFFAVLCLLLLCGLGTESRALRPGKGAVWAAGSVLAAVFAFFTLPYGFSFFGSSGTAYALWPFDLSLAENRLQHCENLDEAGAVADRILAGTDTSMLAWDCKFAQAAAQADYPAMAEYRYQYLRLNPYRPEVYEEMATLLENACQEAPEEIALYKTLAEQTQQLLEEVYQRTSPLAHKIVDRPDFSFRPALLIKLQDIEERY